MEDEDAPCALCGKIYNGQCALAFSFSLLVDVSALMLVFGGVRQLAAASSLVAYSAVVCIFVI